MKRFHRTTPLFLAALLAAAPLHAGGLPRLCLPVEGVTDANAARCAELLSTALGERRSGGGEAAVEMRQHRGRHYALMALRREVALSEIEAALRDSDFTIPREQLLVVGMAVVETRFANGRAEAVAAALPEGLQTAAKQDGRRLSLTIGDPHWIARDLFDQPAVDRTTTITYTALRDTLARHGASLSDIRWVPRYGCRMFGGLAE